MFANLLDRIKGILSALVAIVAGALAIFFLYTRSQNSLNEALLKEAELNKNLDKHDTNIQHNNELLAEEEAKRKELEKGNNEDANIISILDRFRK